MDRFNSATYESDREKAEAIRRATRVEELERALHCSKVKLAALHLRGCVVKDVWRTAGQIEGVACIEVVHRQSGTSYRIYSKGGRLVVDARPPSETIDEPDELVVEL